MSLKEPIVCSCLTWLEGGVTAMLDFNFDKMNLILG